MAVQQEQRVNNSAQTCLHTRLSLAFLPLGNLWRADESAACMLHTDPVPKVSPLRQSVTAAEAYTIS